MEKCESCQGADMTLNKVSPEPDPDEESFWEIMNFNCVFPSCNYKRNDIEEEEFLIHLNPLDAAYSSAVLGRFPRLLFPMMSTETTTPHNKSPV